MSQKLTNFNERRQTRSKESIKEPIATLRRADQHNTRFERKNRNENRRHPLI